MPDHNTIIEFYGGPLDGHLILTDPLPPAVVTFETILIRPRLSLKQRLVRALFLDFSPNKEVTIVANYRFDRRCGRFGYVHVGSHCQTDQAAAVRMEPSATHCG